MKKLENHEYHIHDSCKKEFWPLKEAFVLPFAQQEIEQLARKNIMSRVTITGVQPKISLSVPGTNSDERITIVGGLNGNYILKPPHYNYPELPQIEALSMHLAKACNVETVPFSLIPFQSGELAYITKRIDRENGTKIPMEDFCQLTEKLTEHKYRGSHEQIAKVLKRYSNNKLLNVVRFYEIVLISYLIGNSDMHLKNFSIIQKGNGFRLSPVYDMVATKLIITSDPEDLALTLNGKKNKLKRQDFERAIQSSGLPSKAIKNLIDRIIEKTNLWEDLIYQSFLSRKMAERLQRIIETRKKNFLA